MSEPRIGRPTPDWLGGDESLPWSWAADFVNFVVRPRVVYGWRAEDVKTATKWTFA